MFLLTTSFTLSKIVFFYNYADDNTLSYSHKTLDTTKKVLESESVTVIDWFGDNTIMKSTPGKFQAIMLMIIVKV